MKKRAIKEAISDTLIGMAINIPINFLLISIAFSFELSALQTTAFLTAVFTILAVIRKTLVRLHFAKSDPGV